MRVSYCVCFLLFLFGGRGDQQMIFKVSAEACVFPNQTTCAGPIIHTLSQFSKVWHQTNTIVQSERTSDILTNCSSEIAYLHRSPETGYNW